MNRTLTAVATALLLLAGCSTTTESTPAEPQPTQAVETASAATTPEPTPDPEPLVAVVQDAPEVAPSDPEEAFIWELRKYPVTDTQIPDATDAQLLAAGWEACEQLAEPGVINNDVRVVEGETPGVTGYYGDSLRIAVRAETYLCP